jgi:Skp family chaperone for outer membrane proteins
MQTVRLPLWLVVVVLSAIAGMAISGGMSRAISQDEPASKPCDIAVIDVSEVFERFTTFQKEMRSLKSDVESFELVLKQAQMEILQMKQRMEAAKQGSDERRSLEAELAKRNTDLRTEMEAKRAGFLGKEAASYAVHYHEMEKVVRDIAARRELRLVLRFSGQDFNDKDRNSVLQAVNRPVVFQDQLDITDEVIKSINKT